MDNRKVIYLDDAIDVVSEACFELRGVFGRCEDALKALPSAQPERLTDDDFEKQIHAMFDHIWDCEIDHPVFQDTVGDLMAAVIQCHKGLPSAQPRKGKWVRANTHTDGVYECSACLQWTYIPFHPSNYNYCPRCGSDMRGDDDEI